MEVVHRILPFNEWKVAGRCFDADNAQGSWRQNAGGKRLHSRALARCQLASALPRMRIAPVAGSILGLLRGYRLIGSLPICQAHCDASRWRAETLDRFE